MIKELKKTTFKELVGYSYPTVHRSTVYNSQDMEASFIFLKVYLMTFNNMTSSLWSKHNKPSVI